MNENETKPNKCPTTKRWLRSDLLSHRFTNQTSKKMSQALSPCKIVIIFFLSRNFMFASIHFFYHCFSLIPPLSSSSCSFFRTSHRCTIPIFFGSWITFDLILEVTKKKVLQRTPAQQPSRSHSRTHALTHIAYTRRWKWAMATITRCTYLQMSW